MAVKMNVEKKKERGNGDIATYTCHPSQLAIEHIPNRARTIQRKKKKNGSI